MLAITSVYYLSSLTMLIQFKAVFKQIEQQNEFSDETTLIFVAQFIKAQF